VPAKLVVLKNRPTPALSHLQVHNNLPPGPVPSQNTGRSARCELNEGGQRYVLLTCWFCRTFVAAAPAEADKFVHLLLQRGFSFQRHCFWLAVKWFQLGQQIIRRIISIINSAYPYKS